MRLPDALALIRPIGRHGGLPYIDRRGGLPYEGDALMSVRRRVGHRADRYHGGHGSLPYEGTKHCGIVGWISDSASTDQKSDSTSTD